MGDIMGIYDFQHFYHRITLILLLWLPSRFEWRFLVETIMFLLIIFLNYLPMIIIGISIIEIAMIIKTLRSSIEDLHETRISRFGGDRKREIW